MSGSSPPKARHILKLTNEEKQEFLQSFDIILSDCDGVIWIFVEPILQTGPAITLLKKAGKAFKFVSNNSMRTDREYLQKLTSIGVKDVSTTDLVHPVKTIMHYVRSHVPDPQVLFSLCSDEVNEVLIQNGFNIKTMKSTIKLKSTNLASIIKPKDKVNAVVIDLNFNISFGELARAHQYLLQENCCLLVGAADVLVPVTKDCITLGSADFINMLSERSGKETILLGKPGELLGTHLIEHFAISNPNRALFIGDNLTMDIKFGISCGFKTLLVLTGVSTYEDVLQTPDEFKPNYIANSLADFVEFFSKLVE